MSGGKYDAVVFITDLLQRSNDATQSNPTIFIVDDRLRSANGKDYDPKIVSIGPVHHGEPAVKGMEQQKVRILQQLLQERKEQVSVERLVEEVSKREEEARRCYSESAIFDKDNFLGMLLLDGCFIIQLLRNYFFHQESKGTIFDSHTLIQISHDLLLFENQLPFSVLTALFDVIKTANPDDNLRHLILFLFRGTVPWLDHSKTQRLPDSPDNLLGVVYRWISTKIPSNPDSHVKLLSGSGSGSGSGLGLSSGSSSVLGIQHLLNYLLARIKNSGAETNNSPVIHINSATELKDVGGIRLKTSGEDNTVTFAGKVLKLPPLQVSGETESLLRNLMAYEQLRLGDDDHPRHVIDYMFFLHCLTRSIKDIELLRYSGVITNYLGGDQQILQMFDRLGTNFMTSPEYSYSDVFESLNRYCSHRRNKWMATLRRTHFNTPWSITKFVAAAILLALALAQTIIAGFSLKKQK